MQRGAVGWVRHKRWIREATLSGSHPVTYAQRQGIQRTTAWRVLQRPDVQRYVASVRRWQADQALQARIERESSSVDEVGADDVLP